MRHDPATVTMLVEMGFEERRVRQVLSLNRPES